MPLKFIDYNEKPTYIATVVFYQKNENKISSFLRKTGITKGYSLEISKADEYRIRAFIPSNTQKISVVRACFRECLRLVHKQGHGEMFFEFLPRVDNIKSAEVFMALAEYAEKSNINVYVSVTGSGREARRLRLYDLICNIIEKDIKISASLDAECMYEDVPAVYENECRELKLAKKTQASYCAIPSLSLEDMLRNMDEGFAKTLFEYIDEKGISDVECYKRSNVSKKTFSKIKCDPDYKPSKTTVLSFAIGLKLDIEKTNRLLKTVGMSLSGSNKFDIIIEYFIRSGDYGDIFDVNDTLYKFDQSLLGA